MNATASLDAALAAAMEQIESPIALAETLRALDASVDAMDDDLEPLSAVSGLEEHSIRTRASLAGISAPLRDALLAAAALAGNVRPMRDALLQLRARIEGANVSGDAVDELTRLITSMTESLAQVAQTNGEMTAASARVTAMNEPIAEANDTLGKLLTVPFRDQPSMHIRWGYVPTPGRGTAPIPNALGDMIVPQADATRNEEAPIFKALAAPPELPSIPMLCGLPEEMQRTIALFQAVRQAMGVVIGEMNRSMW